MLPANRYILLASIIVVSSSQDWTNLNCIAPRSPRNGMSFIFDGGQRVEFRCHPGFKLVGNNLAECRRNRWTSQPPKCNPLNATSARGSGLTVTYDITCIDRTKPGQEFVWAPRINGGHVKKYYRARNSSYPFNYYLVAIYECNKGYTLENVMDSRLYCQRRKWIGNRPRCIKTEIEEQPCWNNKGGCHHYCSFVSGEVHCSCRDGFILAGDKKSCLYEGSFPNANKGIQGDDSRERNNPCKDNGGCGHLCDVVEDNAVCSCLNGFQLLPDRRNCIDIDECKENNGGCEGICQNFAGGRTCHCAQGFKLASDRKSCQDQNECLRNNGRGPCSDKCENTRGGYRCYCTIPGTVLGADNETCEDIDECKQDNFGCSHFCKNSYGKAFCHCPPGYQLDEDDKTCIDYNECEIEEFARTCKGKCVNMIGSFRCEDTEELRESTTSSPVCPVGYYLDDKGMCVDIDECQNRTINRCHHKCINTAGSFHCACSDGYSLGRDGVCVDIDECQDHSVHRCQYQCVNTPGSFHCVCASGYRFSDDGICEDIDECQDRRVHRCQYQCVNTLGSFRCACPSGFRISSDGVCEDIDECQDGSVHNCQYQCVNTQGSFRCACPSGYRTRGDGVCEDIDECQQESVNRCHHNCVNTIGSYHCTCSLGYIMNEKGICEGCQKDSYYSEERDACVRCPEFSHTSGTGLSSRSDCICEEGFEGNLAVNDSCIDIDECEKNNGDCSHSCVNTPGSYHCACPLGYQLDKDELSCIDTDECALGKGGCHQGCTNTPGSFRCTCGGGYVISEVNPFTCTDVNECLKDNGGCSHNCVNHEGGHYCQCKNGYRLSSDFRSCAEITCKALPVPHNGKIKCDARAKNGNVPLNTTCRTTCKEGYKPNAAADLKCGEDGDWSGPLPSCISLSCPPLKRPEYGDVHPAGCLTGTIAVFEKCFFTCEPGYRLVGRGFLKCTKALNWRPAKPPRCENNEFRPFIHCPSDVKVTLKPHQNRHYVNLPRPKSNMDPKHIRVYPKWIENLEGNFPSGVTEVHFIAEHPSKNLTASCRVTVAVEDKEPPTAIGCPGDITIYADSLEPVEVNWEEPRFEDNVGIESVVRSQIPGSKFNAGSHVIHYTAEDSSKNIAKCEFTVNVLRKECGEPRDFLHGEKNCMDLLTSRFCEPICDPGYAFFGNASEFYMCGADGIWTPSEDIPDCSPFVAEPDEGCMPGTEFREEIDTGSGICVACLQGMYWDVQTSACIPCPVGTYQDQYGQISCKPCSETEASNPLCNKST